MSGSKRLGKLRWLCRRGMKELDLVLENFLSRQEQSLASGAWPELEEFLATEDDQLWGWVQQPRRAPERFRVLLTELCRGD